jgi:hyperosmotically inducible periplasmic protein
MRLAALAIACLIVAAGCEKKPDHSKDRSTTYETSKPKDVDNTAVNKRDRDGALPTPGDQKSNDADLQRTADIRKRIVDTESLSADAKNVKVVTVNGRVTLRGPVKTLSEKESVARIATEVAGVGNVDDQLEVETATGR